MKLSAMTMKELRQELRKEERKLGRVNDKIQHAEADERDAKPIFDRLEAIHYEIFARRQS